jgi:hypothetical protein
MMRLLAVIVAPLLVCQFVWSQETSDNKSAIRLAQNTQSEFLSEHGFSQQELQELVEIYMQAQIRNTLHLTVVQTDELIKYIGTYKKELTRLKFLQGLLREQLRHNTTQGVSEDLIKTELDQLIKTGSGIATELHKMIDESKKILSVTQSAQLYLFVDDFEQEILQLIKKAQQIQDPSVATGADGATVPGEVPPALRDLVQVETRRLDMPDDDQKDIIDLVDAWMMFEMMQVMDLPDEQFLSLIKHVGQYKDQLYQMKWQIGDSRFQLRSDITAGAADEIVGEQLDNLLLQEEAVADLVESFVSAAQRDVSITMSAKMLLFMVDFERKVINLIGQSNPMLH